MTKTQSKTDYTPGRDARGMYWFDCGCCINNLMSKRCPLHQQAPAMAEALTWAVAALRHPEDVPNMKATVMRLESILRDAGVEV